MKLVEQLKQLNKEELAKLARKHGVSGYAKMTKDELTDILTETRGLAKDVRDIIEDQEDDEKNVVDKVKAKAQKIEKRLAEEVETIRTRVRRRADFAEEKTLPAKASPPPAPPVAVPETKKIAREAEPSPKIDPREPITPPPPQTNGYQQEVGTSKFWGGRPHPGHYVEEEGELPQSYNENKITLLPRDPRCVFAYWDCREDTAREISRRLAYPRAILRVHMHEERYPRGDQAPMGYFDVEVALNMRNYYVHLPRAGMVCHADLGLVGADGAFEVLARSPAVRTPIDGPSSIIDDQFVTVPFDMPLGQLGIMQGYIGYGVVPLPGQPAGDPEFHDRLAALSGGLDLPRGLSSAEMLQWLKTELGRHVSSQPGSFQYSSEALVRGGFWLRASTEVIIYGRTAPEATVMVGGRRIAVDQEGYFEVHYHLGEGAKLYPIVAVSADGSQREFIVPEIGKKTGEVSANATAASARRSEAPF